MKGTYTTSAGATPATVHRPDCIQSFGFLLAMSADWLVVHASGNLERFLAIEPAAAIGIPLDALIDVLTLHDIRNRMVTLRRPNGMERLYRKTLIAGRAPFDLAVHYAGPLIILEGETSRLEGEAEAAALMRGIMTRPAPCTTLEALCRDGARKMRVSTGFARVMVYRFADAGPGQVVAESLANGMESFLGRRVPGLDVPVDARPLYLRNLFHVIADVSAPPVAVCSGPDGGAALPDLSLALTQAAAPATVEHLKRMGVAASLSLSIVVDGELWGLIVCHDPIARLPDNTCRAAVELFGQFFSLTLANWLTQQASKLEEEQRRSHERQELLIAELNHRVRNIFALIRGIISQTQATQTDVSKYVESLSGRIQAVARAHDQITQQNWGAGKLSALLDGEISAYLPERKDRFTLLGTDVSLQPAAFSTFSLVVHELVTNSAKYGSLSDSGRVVVTLDRQVGVGLFLTWQEVDGPIVMPPQHRGFGSVIIERIIPYDLQGTVKVCYPATGLQAEFFIPEVHIAAAATDAPAGTFRSLADDRLGKEPATDTPLSGCNVLLLEDNMIIALEAEDLLRDLGSTSVFTASTVGGAEQILKTARIDWAVLDVNLGASNSLGLAERIRGAGIPFIFVSGYGENTALGELHRHSLTVTKPFSHKTLGSAIVRSKAKERPSSGEGVMVSLTN